MKQITVNQMPAFKRAYKKLHASDRHLVNEAVETILLDPAAGEQKKGDLVGIFVYKFKIRKQQMLLAYRWRPKERMLLALGVHENFYRDLKR